MSVHQRPDGRWFCKWYENGKEKRKYFGFGELAELKAKKHDESIKEAKGKFSSRIDSITVAELLEAYQKERMVRPSTDQSDAYRIRNGIGPRLGAYSADVLSSKELNAYVSDRLKTGKKLRSISRELDILKAAYNWGLSQQPPLVFRNPLSNYRIKRGRESEIPSPPSIEEIRRIIAHAPDHLRRVILIGWYCGVRPGGEVSRIRWSDVNLERQEIRIISAMKGSAATRFIPMHPDLAKMFEDWKSQDIGIFKQSKIDNLPVVHYRGRIVASLKRAWASAKKRAGISRRLRLYDLRHAMASMALQNKADLKATSEVLGHSRPDTTLLIYQHVIREQHREVVMAIPSLALTPNITTSVTPKQKT